MAQVELEKVTEVFCLLVESSTETILSIQTQTANSSKGGQDIHCSAKVSQMDDSQGFSDTNV